MKITSFGLLVVAFSVVFLGKSAEGQTGAPANNSGTEVSLLMVEGEFRLVGASNPNEGRVEVFHNGVWGTVCDDGFGQTEADMVCRAMGFRGAHSYACCAANGQGSGQIWLDDLNCAANAVNLGGCTGWSWGRHNCGHREDVSVRCTEFFRLVGGISHMSGRVEVFHDNVWGTVCDDSFGQNDADMICRTMGYHAADSFACCAANGQGSGQIWLDDLNCPVNATNLDECSGWSWGRHNCGHTEDVSVTCTNMFRLVGGTSSSNGRVEVFHNGVWGTICDDLFGQTEADMICRAMGYSGAQSYSCCAAYGAGSGQIWLDNLNCPAGVSSLDRCTGWYWGQHNCVHHEDAGVACITDSEVPFRLVGGTSALNGRVEVFHNGVWGTVCDDSFGQTEADMICRTLGYPEAESFACCAASGPGSGQIWLDDLNCAVNATNLNDCTGWSWGRHNCGHSEDVSVTCRNIFRLVGGTTPSSGRVEVYHDGVWGTVCDDLFGQTDADMVCRTMGHPGAVSYACCAANGQGSGPIWLDDLTCGVNATSLDGCTGWSWGRHNCRHYEDVSVTCRTSFRLVGGTGPSNGRVEVFHDNVWGTVCDDSFGQTEADMICRSMGYSDGARSFACCAAYGAGSGQIWLDDLNCPAGVSSLDRCSGWSWGIHNCVHGEDAGVACITDSAVATTVAPMELTTAQSNSAGCGTSYLSGSSGTISSPNYPANYPNNANCLWTICSGSGQVIKISVGALRLESQSTCFFDALKFSNTNAFLDGETKCGRTDVGYSTFVSTGSCVYVRFTSDGSVTDSGFRISYQALSRAQRSAPRLFSNKIKVAGTTEVPEE